MSQLTISFQPLWEKLFSLNMSVGEFKSATGLGSSTMTKLRNNECVTTDTLLKICKVLRCELNEVINLKDESNVEN